MNDFVIAVAVLGAASMLTKGLGPVMLGGRPLPPRLAQIAARLPVAMLASLIASLTVATTTGIAIDGRLAGLSVAIGLLLLRTPPLIAVVAAAATAALLRTTGP